ncbi:MAG: thioredoxin family protein [Campylobacterales bacterium]|nr:thioredoxin family protein [Campylobacterales bacterium]
MKRISKIVIGLGLVVYAAYSGNSWFYLGAILIISGVTNFCPLEKLTGGCSSGSCCAPSSKEEIKSACCSSSDEASKSICCSPQTSASWSENKIEILGTGCPNCIALEKVVTEAVNQMQLHIPVVKVSDINEIMKYQVMSTPSLVINGVVKSTGKLLNIEEVKSLLKEIQ